MAIVELIEASSRFLILSEKLPAERNPFMMEEKIVDKVPWDASGKQNMLNLLDNLCVITALPPDGGAAQAMTVVSSTSFQVHSPRS